MKMTFTMLLVLQMIFISSAMANEEDYNYDEICIVHVVEEKVYDAICVNEEELKQANLIDKLDGYKLLEYKNQ